MELKIIHDAVDFLKGEEQFSFNGTGAGFNVLDFWRFQFSNLPDMQGRVGEFLVAMALEKATPDNNNGWTLWDINYRGKRIEVKTTAYYQPWRDVEDNKEVHDQEEKNYSDQRTFGIKKSIDPNDKQRKRMNDIYVFVLNTGKNKTDADPLVLEHWEFYVVPTSIINEQCKDNKSIGFGKVKKLAKQVNLEKGLSFKELKSFIDGLIDEQL